MWSLFFAFLTLCFSMGGVQGGGDGGKVMLALRQRNTDILVDAFHAVSNPESPEYGNYWSQDKIDALVSPPAEEIHRLVGYLKDTGVECIQRGAALQCSHLPCLAGLSSIIDLSLIHI